MEQPGIRGSRPPSLDEELASKAIETSRRVLSLAELGPLICHSGPRGEAHCYVPLMYQGFALDRIHYDPWSRKPLPLGVPHVWGRGTPPRLGAEELQEIMRELRILEAAEFREPERAWAVPVAWRSFMVTHIRVDLSGAEVVPDYPLTQEVARYAQGPWFSGQR